MRLIRKLHLYFGLISGVFVFLICLTGTIYVFNDEIIRLANHNALTVAPQTTKKLDADMLLQSVSTKGYQPQQFVYSKDPNSSVYVLAKNSEGKFVQIYIDPYTGEILKTSSLYNFFNFIESFHTELFLDAPGRAFIGIITVLFFVLLITGLVLWYPPKWNRKTAKNSFIFKFRGKRTVVNYNLHKVLGFYIVLPAILLSVTGTIMAFDPIEIEILRAIKADGDYESYVDNLVKQRVAEAETLITYQSLVENNSIWKNRATELRITLPEAEDAQYILCESADNFGMKYGDNYSFQYIDRTTGEHFNLHQDTSKSLAIKKGISELHTGKMMGLGYKILLFIIGLILISLPVTGYVIYYNKYSKKRKKTIQAK